jgi:hypothetical protein
MSAFDPSESTEISRNRFGRLAGLPIAARPF